MKEKEIIFNIVKFFCLKNRFVFIIDDKLFVVINVRKIFFVFLSYYKCKENLIKMRVFVEFFKGEYIF